MTALLMALAGGLGAGTRYALDGALRPRLAPGFPWSTQVINITGSLLLGLLLGAGAGDTGLTIAGTGFLGGYTTFSAASVETVHLALERRHGAAVANATAMLVLSVAAATLGYALGSLLR